MSAVAKLLKDGGTIVGGSDEAFYPPVSDYLVDHGIPFVEGYAAANIPIDVDVIVIGKHARLVPEENEEVRAAFESGKPVRSYPEILHGLTQSTTNYVVAGSFGKSTGTSIAAWVLLNAGKDPSFMVGALSPSLTENARLGAGGVFVLEGDEYPSANWDDTSKFLYFNTNHLLLTSCEHDHVNVFPTLGDYLKPFEQLVVQTSIRTITACLDGAHVDEVLAGTPLPQPLSPPGKGETELTLPVTWYSLRDRRADYWAEDIRRAGEWVEFKLIRRGERVVSLRSRMLGEHNVQNVVGVGAMLLETGLVDPAELAAGIESFLGVRRRLELKTKLSVTPLYEDFGSSRAKLLAGIRAVREQFPDRKLIVAFEPHTFSFRNRGALAWYDDLFDGVDDVSVFSPPSHGAGSHDQLTQAEIVERIASTGTPVRAVVDKEGLRAAIEPLLTEGPSVILVETSGNIGGVVPYLVDWLDA